MTGARTAEAIRRGIEGGETSAAAVCEATFRRIARLDPALHAFLSLDEDGASAAAGRLDTEAPAGNGLTLAGVPVAVKDNLCTAGTPTTAGSRILERFVPPYEATAIVRLRRAGALIVGKANCDEFAMGSSTENSAFGPTRNPWALDRVPGGSSGGSAAAVASGLVPVAIGSDTGGSVRQPAALCGVVGLKPTYGRVSRYGLIAFASSLDQIGPMAHTVRDVADVLAVMAGPDPADATASIHPVPDFAAALTGSIRGLRIGVVPELLGEGVDRPVRALVDAALEVLAAQGATVVEIDLPHARFGIATYYLIATAEASSNLARYDGVRYGFRATSSSGRRPARAVTTGDMSLREMYEETRAQGFGAEVKRRIMLGTYALSAGYAEQYYVKAQQVRTLIRRDYERAFGAVDVIATPTSPTPAFRLGERVDDPLRMYLADTLTVGPSLAGLPALSVPCGFAAGSLPVGLQLVGRPYDEATILRVGDTYQRHTSWHLREPRPGHED